MNTDAAATALRAELAGDIGTGARLPARSSAGRGWARFERRRPPRWPRPGGAGRWMGRYAQGEDTAFAELFRHGAPRVRASYCAFASTGPRRRPTQETFLRVHLARGRFERGAPALPWLLAVARNVFLDSVRHAKVRRNASAVGTSPRIASPKPRHPPTGDQPARRARDGRHRPDDARQQSVTLREAFVLIRFEGMSVAEAAQILALPRPP